MIKVKGLDHICLGAPEPDALAEFYVDRWGLQLIDRDGAAGAAYLRAAESNHHALALKQSETRGMLHIAFEVVERDDLDRAVEDALAEGAEVEQAPGTAAEPGYRAGARIKDPDGNTVELLWGPERVTDDYRARVVRPRKLGHVVLNTPRPEAMEAFYRRIGYRVTDRTQRNLSFMRNGTGDHHSLALVKSTRTGMQHMAYDVVALDNVMTALGKFRTDGFQCVWGPGRHGPGNNIFTYYRDPAGHIIEYYAEMQQVTDAEEANLEERFWGPEHKGDQWGFAGPPPKEFTDPPPAEARA
jgi:catechol 2,3-dioxygenase-like lactoylglutathione lyase family enzyme